MLARPSLSHFSELGRMLGWQPWTKIMTLWAFFDESGHHHTKVDGGGLKHLTIGGCIANFETWESLSLEWAPAVTAMGLEMFHMTDFEARKEPYKDWSNDQRKERLNVLLDIIGSAKPVCYSFSNPSRPGESDTALYKRCARDLIRDLSLYDEEFSIVFAHYPGFTGYSPLHQMIMDQGYGSAVKSVAIGYPQDMCSLQAADIVAYEICRHERDLPIHRYPIRRLQELGCVFRVAAGVE